MPENVRNNANHKSDYSELHSKLDQVIENHIRIPGRPAWIVLCGYAIGETSTFCSFANEFVKTHGHGIILVITPKHESVARMYSHRFLKIIVISEDWMRYMLRSGYIPQDRFELDQPLSGCWIDLGFRHSDGIKYLGRYPGRGGIGEFDMMRFCLRLPWNARMEQPKILPEWEEEAWQIAKSAGVRIGRSVLLCPINNSQKKYPDIFWKTVASRLRDNGYDVFTNMGGLNAYNGPPTMPIEGTVPVELPIHLVMPFLNFAGRGISGSNGMFMFIMIAGFESFKMTQLVGVLSNKEEDHTSLGYNLGFNITHKHAVVQASMQYTAPEVCLRVPLDEYIVPYDASLEEYISLAKVVADQNTEDSSCIKHYDISGKPFFEAHADWLRDLI